MGGQTSIETKKNGGQQTILHSFCKNIKKEIGVLKKTLNEIAQAHTLSLKNEHLLGQSFSRIENQVTSLQNQLNKQNNPLMMANLREFSTFFLNIEWNMSDIKTAAHPNWSNVYPIIKQIQTFMETRKNFPQFEAETPSPTAKSDREEKALVFRKIKELEKKIQIINREIKIIP